MLRFRIFQISIFRICPLRVGNPYISIKDSSFIWHFKFLILNISLIFSLGAPQILKSPAYPENFDPQVQCLWNVESDGRIQIDFLEWTMPTSAGLETVFGKSQNTLCSLCYLEITYYDAKVIQILYYDQLRGHR
jgi:hypothetical protein